VKRELPILFSGPMVRALLAGRKTQTRRLVPVQPYHEDEYGLWHVLYPWGEGGHGIYESEQEMRAEYDRLLLTRGSRRYGEPGDLLWVRETWRAWDEETCDLNDDDHTWRAWDEETCDLNDDDHTCSEHCHQRYVAYAATPQRGYRPIPDRASITYLDQSTPLYHNPDLLGPWKPSIFMPRWASRLTLRRTAPLRLERLTAITWQDIRDEGIDCPEHDFASGFCCSECPALRRAWQEGWDRINGKRAPFGENPFVYVAEFEVQDVRY
jgi:hypothetical protein